MVDHLRQIFAKAVEQIVSRHTGLLGKRIDPVGSERAGQIVRRYSFVGSGANPGIDGVTVAALLKLLEHVVQAATDNAPGGTAGK